RGELVGVPAGRRGAGERACLLAAAAALRRRHLRRRGGPVDEAPGARRGHVLLGARRHDPGPADARPATALSELSVRPVLHRPGPLRAARRPLPVQARGVPNRSDDTTSFVGGTFLCPPTLGRSTAAQSITESVRLTRPASPSKCALPQKPHSPCFELS